MKLYRYSPVEDRDTLFQALLHIHRECSKLCYASLGEYVPVAGNIGFFCHYDDEYRVLTELRERLTDASDNINQKYFRLHEPIRFSAEGNIPEAIYTYLYIRKPDIYRAQVGDVDFVMEQERYQDLKGRLQNDDSIPGARVFPRADLDMIELYDPDVDVLGYVRVRDVGE